MHTLPLHVLVLAAGQGTRMKSATAKVLHKALGRPLMHYPVALAAELGAQSTVAVVGHQAESVRAAFAGTPLKFALQAEQKGTGHAVLCARGELPAEGTLLIVTGDTPLLRTPVFRDFIQMHQSSGAAVSVLAADYPDPTGYGRVMVDSKGRVERIVEHKDANPNERAVTLCNTGMYLCDIAILFRLLEKVRPNNAQGEYYLTDVISLARSENLPVGMVRAPDHADFLGVNDRVQLAEASAILQQRVVESLLRSGVTFTDPRRVYVEPSVQIGADCLVEGGVHLSGTTRIGARCSIEQGARIENSSVADGAHIKAYSVIEDAVVGPACIIGPMAHLRAGTVLDAEVHIGNYVETKKTQVGRKSKANHLSYLGDSQIGSGVNVGAGTITCNYDGVNKHLTVIDDGAFIGSDTQLVAPVRVGKNAIVGAGTTVTHEVPDGALAVSRAPQKNIEGYAARKKGKPKTGSKS